MSDVTQTKVDEVFSEIKEKWDSLVSESGQSEAMYIALDSTGTATNFLYEYNYAKEQVEKEGLVMPELVAGLTVKVCEDEKEMS